MLLQYHNYVFDVFVTLSGGVARAIAGGGAGGRHGRLQAVTAGGAWPPACRGVGLTAPLRDAPLPHAAAHAAHRHPPQPPHALQYGNITTNTSKLLLFNLIN